MLSISFRNRIALYYSITVAALVFLLLAVIFFIVKAGVYNDLDQDLTKEMDDLLTEITITGNGFSVIPEEWHEKEHNTLDINPIFIQFTTASGELFDRSPNLKQSTLLFRKTGSGRIFYDSTLSGKQVRQAQLPVTWKNNIVGYILVAAPLEDATAVLQNLEKAILIAYPLLLLILFSIASLLAGRSIRPVNDIIYTARKISHESLSSRIPFPKHKDELYSLSQTINDLLSRIENAVIREKQFTSHASHELRTPLAVIKGTLEVLIRKKRNEEEMVETVRDAINELDRVNLSVDQLLLLARFESQKEAAKIESISLNAAFLEVISRYSSIIKDREIQLNCLIGSNVYVMADTYLLSIILDNLISNAIKYSDRGAHVDIQTRIIAGTTALEIRDSGIGIASDELEKIFSPFYRSDAESHISVKGSGLGLSIVKRICQLLDVQIQLESQLNEGTKVTLIFSSIISENQN